MVGYAITVSVAGCHLTRACPSLALGRARVNDRLAHSWSRRGLPLDAMAFSAAPGAEVHVEIRGLATDAHRCTRSHATYGALDQQVTALCEAQPTEIYLHDVSRRCTNVSMVPNRSTASESCA